MKSLFFVPVFDQVEELPGLLAELTAAPLACDTLLFVNNGSTDGSAEMIHSSGFPFIDVPRNRGIGYGFMAAADWGLERGYGIFGVLAGNGKMLPVEMPRVLDPVRSGAADYVTGSRFLAGGASPNLPGFRRGTIPLVNLWVWALTGRHLTDSTCGYRCYRFDLLRRAAFDWHAPWLEGYGFEYYVYAKVLRDRNLRTMEVPITMRYPPSGRRYSKIRPLVGWWDMMKPFLRARLDGRGFSQETAG